MLNFSILNYFLKFWGPFESLFASLDDLNVAVTSCIHQTAQHYGSKTVFEQFATRFLMKEVHYIHLYNGSLIHQSKMQVIILNSRVISTVHVYIPWVYYM